MSVLDSSLIMWTLKGKLCDGGMTQGGAVQLFVFCKNLCRFS